LRVVLNSLKFQTYKDFEIIVSEDGEYREMKDFLENYIHPNKIIHLTQPDIGWRKNRALNNAIRNCSGDYLIFIDGDCVLHHKFVENHIRFSSQSNVIAGKRVKLGPEFSAKFRKNIDALASLEQEVVKSPIAVKKDNGQFWEESFYCDPDGLFGFIPKLRKMNQLKGCNMSFYRTTIEKINGFDEDYILPAIGEDIDLTWRFKGMGFKLFSVRNLAVQYHLFHKENWNDQLENEKMMQDKISRNIFVCSNGLVKLN
jgi:cellulose synthase/poly-beta-1,6-N-acetylglucosamine synthase-like glycosyltransferase